MEHTKRLSLAKESYVLLAISFLDLIITIWLVVTNRAIEGNPLMAFYMNHGLFTLVFVKILLVVLPIFVAEWGRRYRPRFVHAMLRFAILAYVGVYLMAFINTDMLASDHGSSPPSTYHEYEPRVTKTHVTLHQIRKPMM